MNNYILIAEDDSDDQLLLQEAIDTYAQGLPIHFLKNGIAVTGFLTETDEQPALIFMDINMPKMDGFTTLKWIRDQGKYQNIPIIMLTTSSNKQEEQKCLTAGANKFYLKPASFGGLLQIVKQVLDTYILPVSN